MMKFNQIITKTIWLRLFMSILLKMKIVKFSDTPYFSFESLSKFLSLSLGDLLQVNTIIYLIVIQFIFVCFT